MTRIRLVLALVAVAVFGGAQAATPQERELLTRLSQEIDVIQSLAAQARQHADDSERIDFDYRRFRLDLRRLQLGIDAYLDGAVEAPREYPPMAGDYRR